MDPKAYNATILNVGNPTKVSLILGTRIHRNIEASTLASESFLSWGRVSADQWLTVGQKGFHMP